MTILAERLSAADRRQGLQAPDGLARPDAAASLDTVLLGHQDRLRRLVHRLLGWPAAVHNDLDDLVQDVLLAAWRHRGSFRGDCSASTWLYRIALRRVQSHVRWRRVRRGLQSLHAAAEPPARPGPGDAADRQLDAVHTAMAGLRHRDREVLVLHYLEQRGIGDLAALLGCSRDAVDQRLSRARRRLRDLLPAADTDGGERP